MFGSLIPLGGGDPIPLLKEKLLIGRRDSCDIRLDYPNISSKHCELELRDSYWHLRDLGSSNGTKVNGERVVERFLLPGDVIVFAKHRYEVSYTPDPSVPAPVQANDPFAVSLMEKAGLERREKRPERPKLPPSARPVPPVVKNKDKPDDDDLAMQFLSE